MDDTQRKKELEKLNQEMKRLTDQRKQVKDLKKYDEVTRIDREMQILKNKGKHHLFKLGQYRYPDDEEIEINPGVFMNANMYHWMKD